MLDLIDATTNRVSRRRLLTMASGATVAATLGPASLAARQMDEATPSDAATPAGVPALPEFPMPSTLAADASPLFRAVTDTLVEAMRQSLVPGAAIGLLAGDREEHATFGLASLSSLQPVTPDTLFQIGSITKTMTATAIWRLIDEGALDLDAPVRTYITDLALMDSDVAAQVTIGNLLDHTAGWYGDEGFATGEEEDAIARYVAERLPQLPQVFPLGEYFSYNNAAFTLLGRLIEVATGTDYNSAMGNLLFGPLGLDDSLLDPVEVRERHYADGHGALPVNGRLAVAVMTPLWLPRSVNPAGSVWSTTRDLMRYARFHMNRNTTTGAANIVHPDSLALMQEPAIGIPGTSLQMGRDWFLQDVDGIRAVYHGGDTLGQHAELIMIPEHDFALAVLTNGQGGGSLVVAAALDAALAEVPELASLLGKIGLIASLTAAADASTVDLTDVQMAEYVGRYADPGEAFTVAKTENGLELSHETIQQPGVFLPAINPPSGPPAPLAFLAEDMGIVNQARIPFIRNADGQVGWLSSGLRLIPRVSDDA